MPQTQSELLAQALAQRGVKRVFGMPGGDVLPFLDALKKNDIDFVLVRHETSAAFMADATAQLGEAPGVCVATLGPGATQLLSGVVGAELDRSSVVAITGTAAQKTAGIYSHQRIDHGALYAPFCRHSVTLGEHHFGAEVSHALRFLDSAMPGPVHLNLPADVAQAQAKPQDEILPPLAGGGLARLGKSLTAPTQSLEPIAQALKSAKRPMILAGLQDRGPELARALTALAEKLGAPVWTTYKAKGLLDENHTLSMGAVGLSPVADAVQRELLDQADVMLWLGYDPVEMRPHWLSGWPKEQRFIGLYRHTVLDLPKTPELYLEGYLPNLCDALTQMLPQATPHFGEEVLQAHKKKHLAVFEEQGAPKSAEPKPVAQGLPGPASVLEVINETLPSDTVVALDVGAHRITASHVWRCKKPNTLLQSNGFSSMGYGLPGAIAAALEYPTRQAVAITGDMGLWMTLGELGICQEQGLNPIIIYLADLSLSLIELKQERLGFENSGVRFENPDVVALAKAFGGVGEKVQGLEALRTSLANAQGREVFTLLEVAIDGRWYRQQM